MSVTQSLVSKPVTVFNQLIVWWADGLVALVQSPSQRSAPWRTMLLRRGSTIEVHARRGQATQLLGVIDPSANPEEPATAPPARFTFLFSPENKIAGLKIEAGD